VNRLARLTGLPPAITFTMRMIGALTASTTTTIWNRTAAPFMLDLRASGLERRGCRRVPESTPQPILDPGARSKATPWIRRRRVAAQATSAESGSSSAFRATGMSIDDLYRYAELMQEGDSTAPERLRLLEDHRRRIKDEMRELATGLELVERKIAGYAGIAGGVVVDPPDGRPAIRRRGARHGDQVRAPSAACRSRRYSRPVCWSSTSRRP